MKSKESLSATLAVLTLGILMQPSLTNGQAYAANHRRLVDALLGHHEPNVLPLYSQSSQPLNLTIALHLLDILEVDIERNQVEFLFYLSKEYKDEALMWDPELFGGLDKVRLRRDQVWRPDVVFQGDIGSASGQPDQSDIVEVGQNGTVNMTDKRRVRTLCQVYALSDRHAATCEVKVAPASYDRSLLWLNEPTEYTPSALLFSPTSKYQLLEFRARKDTLHYVSASYEEMVFTITFGRITPPDENN